MSVSLSIEGINMANVTTSLESGGGQLAANENVVIKYDNGVSEVTVLDGFVDTIEQQSVAEFVVTVTEQGNELQNVYMEDDGTDFVIEISNILGTKSNGDYVDIILNIAETTDSGWRDNSPSANQNLTTVLSSGANIPSKLFTYITCYDALNRYINDTCGLKYRFEYDHTTGNKYVVYGTVTDYSDSYKLSTTSAVDITNDVIKFNQVGENFDYNVERVVVIGLTETNGTAQYYGEAVVSPTPPKPYRSLVYQFSDLSNNDEAAAIANNVLEQRNGTNERYEIKLPVGYTGFREGDWITYDSSQFCIYDITYSQSETKFGVQGNRLGTKEMFSGHKLVDNSGAFVGTQATWDGSPQNVGDS